MALLGQVASLLENGRDAAVTDLLAFLLFRLNTYYRPVDPVSLHPERIALVRKLRVLIEKHYKQERGAPFYAARLGIDTRQLNTLTRLLCGRLVQDMVNDRLLSEAEVLLGGTGYSIKEIAYQLGFIDHAHFGAFFKRHKGCTATAFRRRLRG